MSARPTPRGVRFAPSPTGRFHVGNLRTAWISREIARALGEPWVVRFEDIDSPRVLPEAMEEQLADLEALGMKPDLVLVQSQLRERHWEAFLALIRAGQIYPCFCSRKEVQEDLRSMASAPHSTGAHYSGRCRKLVDPAFRESEAARSSLPSIAWRIRMPREDGAEDFIVARSSPRLTPEGRPAEKETFQSAYNWACAIDDSDGGYSWIVRAADLKGVLGLQRRIQTLISGTEAPRFPSVFHCSLVTRNDGGRLEKRTEGVTLRELVGSGLGISGLLALFRKSVEPGLLESLANEPRGSSRDEARVSLTLEELGI